MHKVSILSSSCRHGDPARIKTQVSAMFKAGEAILVYTISNREGCFTRRNILLTQSLMRAGSQKTKNQVDNRNESRLERFVGRY